MKKIQVIVLALCLCLAASPAWALFGSGEVELEAQATNLVREVARGDYKLVTSTELKKMLDAKQEMLIIDTMPLEASYNENHIPGAVQFLFPIPEMEEMSQEEQAKFRELLGPDQDKMLVFYCGFTKCTRSHNGAMWARKLGYTNVYRCPGGIKAWMQQDFAVEEVE